MAIRGETPRAAAPALLREFGRSLAADRAGTLARFAAFLFRRVVGRRRRLGLNSGFALFTLQSVDLVAQPLIVRLRFAQVGRHLLNQVQEPNDQFPRVLVLDSTEVKVFQHQGCSLPIRLPLAKGSILSPDY